MKSTLSPLPNRVTSRDWSSTENTSLVTGTADETSSLVFEEETVTPTSHQHIGASLRLLARWLVSAARKGAPGAHSSPVEGSQNPLDVPRDTEVVSKAR